MSSSVGLVGFGPASGIDPYTNRRRLRIRRVLGGDLMQLVNIPFPYIYTWLPTVKPLVSVVDWVDEGRVIGDAKPRFTGWIDFKALRLRRAWFRLNAKRREAIARSTESTTEEWQRN